MPPPAPNDKRQTTKEHETGRKSFRVGLWMDEMVDKMMEQSPSGYVDFHTTYKEDLRKLYSKS